ncbi:ABC transporter substrate-binding protein [Caviibacter abscessus]|uniref:ABC transporter substrate-binding protein n=1 Tax=Caviibacter abscessus TaxID=1766719 RepID=UPI000832E97A|nr:ABC transporter substrate-binding protein [Caviibacter abscessus]
MSKILKILFMSLICFGLLISCGSTKEKELKKITIVLDWVPNTNHTGLFVAKDKGYFKEQGIEVEIVQPAQDSSSSIVAAGKAQFGIYFQPNMVKKILKNVPITAVAAILQHNTSGIMSLKENGITSPKDLSCKVYSTWEDAIDDATVKEVITRDGGDYSKVKFAPGETTDALTGLKAKLFDFIFVYEAWDYTNAKLKGVDVNFFRLKDYVPEFDYYSPVIIANNDFLKNKEETAKKVLKSIKKGYEYSVINPLEAADILIKNAPEGNKELIRESQKFISNQYISDAKAWGIIDSNRWNAFYTWLYDNKIIEEKLPENAGFTNKYLED